MAQQYGDELESSCAHVSLMSYQIRGTCGAETRRTFDGSQGVFLKENSWRAYAIPESSVAGDRDCVRAAAGRKRRVDTLHKDVIGPRE